MMGFGIGVGFERTLIDLTLFLAVFAALATSARALGVVRAEFRAMDEELARWQRRVLRDLAASEERESPP